MKHTVLELEKKAWLDKEYMIFFTFPMKFIDNKQLDKLYKDYKDIYFNIVFSKRLIKNSTFHIFNPNYIEDNFSVEKHMLLDELLFKVRDIVNKK